MFYDQQRLVSQNNLFLHSFYSSWLFLAHAFFLPFFIISMNKQDRGFNSYESQARNLVDNSNPNGTITVLCDNQRYNVPLLIVVSRSDVHGADLYRLLLGGANPNLRYYMPQLNARIPFTTPLCEALLNSAYNNIKLLLLAGAEQELNVGAKKISLIADQKDDTVKDILNRYPQNKAALELDVHFIQNNVKKKLIEEEAEKEKLIKLSPAIRRAKDALRASMGE